MLEKSYFCSITNIMPKIENGVERVVICLKNRTFAVSQTSYDVYVEDTQGCDLLEKSYFCSITNIWGCSFPSTAAVVICLKNRTFAVSQTSGKHTRGRCCGCDLLEKSYFCSITNIRETARNTAELL